MWKCFLKMCPITITELYTPSCDTRASMGKWLKYILSKNEIQEVLLRVTFQHLKNHTNIFYWTSLPKLKIVLLLSPWTLARILNTHSAGKIYHYHLCSFLRNREYIAAHRIQRWSSTSGMFGTWWNGHHEIFHAKVSRYPDWGRFNPCNGGPVVEFNSNTV